MGERDDSGMLPLTRDGGYRMVQMAIKEFEGNVWMPAVTDLKRKIERNDGKTDELILALNRVRASVKTGTWIIGLIVAAAEAWSKLHGF